MTRKVRNVLVAGVAALVVLPAAAMVASAGIPDDDGVIHACYVTASGAVRIVDSDAKTCKRGEQAIRWNVEGPAGKPGEQGPPGEPGAAMAGYTTTFGPVAVPTANASTPALVILAGLPDGPSFAIASVGVSNGSGQPVSLICALGEAGPAYSFDVPGNPGGPGPYRTLVSFTGRSGSSGVPLGCHVWGDPAQPIADVTVSGSIQAVSLGSVTVQP